MVRKTKVTISGSEISGAIKAINQQPLEIKSAKLAGDFCNYSYELEVTEHSKDEINRKGSTIVHDDMKLLFKKLHPHLAVICEEINPDEIKDIDNIVDYDKDNRKHKEGGLEHKVSHFIVSAFSITGTGENESVSLTGSKRLSTGDLVELKSPKIKFDGHYQFINELRTIIDDLKLEVEEYMNGKAKPQLVQSEMGFEGAEGENEEEE